MYYTVIKNRPSYNEPEPNKHQGSSINILIIFCETGTIEEAIVYYKMAFGLDKDEASYIMYHKDHLEIKEGIDYDIAYKYFNQSLVNDLEKSLLRWLHFHYWTRNWSSEKYVNNQYETINETRIKREIKAIDKELASMDKEKQSHSFNELTKIKEYYELKDLSSELAKIKAD